MKDEEQNSEWLAVIGRALSFLCLSQADLRDKGIAKQAPFLYNLGLSRKDAAQMLNTTEKSITEVLSRERRKGVRGAKSKKNKR